MTDGDYSAHPAPEDDRTVCQACGFPGNPWPFHPARDAEPAVTVTGTTYHPGHAADKVTVLTPRSGQCAFCGTTLPDTARITWGGR